QLVERVDVEGVARGDDEGAVLAGQRHQGAAVDELERQRLERLRLDGGLRQVHQVHAQLLPQEGQDVLLLGEALLHEQFMERAVRRRLLDLLDPRQVGRLEFALLDKALRKVHVNLAGGTAVQLSMDGLRQGGWVISNKPGNSFKVTGRSAVVYGKRNV